MVIVYIVASVISRLLYTCITAWMPYALTIEVIDRKVETETRSYMLYSDHSDRKTK